MRTGGPTFGGPTFGGPTFGRPGTAPLPATGSAASGRPGRDPLGRGKIALTPPSPASKGEDDKLRDASRQLGGVFTEQLFKAMRATVPEDEGIVSGGSGEEMFTGMLDQHLASDTRAEWARGLGDAIYRRLRAPGHHAPAGTDTAGTTAAAVTSGGHGASLDTTPGALAPLRATPPAFPLGTGR